MAKFLVEENVQAHVPHETFRLGAGTGSSNHLKDSEVGKFVKLAGESRFALAAAGDSIEGRITSVEKATLDDYTIGSVQRGGRMRVTCDGDEATPGTGTLAVGDYVVVGTVVAKDTALSAPPRVCKATVQPFTVIADGGEGTIEDAMKRVAFPWRVISLGSVGTGAVGTEAIIERVGASS